MTILFQILYTVQLAYKRTVHTSIIRAYFVYSCMSIHTHIRIYTQTYMHIYVCMSLCYAFPYVSLCEALLVKQTLYFFGIKMASKQICILLKHHADQWKLSYFEYSITSIMQIHLQTTVYLHLLDLKLLKMGWKLKQLLELTILTHELFVSTSKELFIKVSMACCWH